MWGRAFPGSAPRSADRRVPGQHELGDGQAWRCLSGLTLSRDLWAAKLVVKSGGRLLWYSWVKTPVQCIRSDSICVKLRATTKRELCLRLDNHRRARLQVQRADRD